MKKFLIVTLIYASISLITSYAISINYASDLLENETYKSGGKLIE